MRDCAKPKVEPLVTVRQTGKPPDIPSDAKPMPPAARQDLDVAAEDIWRNEGNPN
jgi:hypothetical protein